MCLKHSNGILLAFKSSVKTTRRSFLGLWTNEENNATSQSLCSRGQIAYLLPACCRRYRRFGGGLPSLRERLLGGFSACTWSVLPLKDNATVYRNYTITGRPNQPHCFRFTLRIVQCSTIKNNTNHVQFASPTVRTRAPLRIPQASGVKRRSEQESVQSTSAMPIGRTCRFGWKRTVRKNNYE